MTSRLGAFDQRAGRCARDAVQTGFDVVDIAAQGREVWIQQVGNGQLMIGVDVEDGDTEYANLVLRPLATNLVSLQLEMEPVEADDDALVQSTLERLAEAVRAAAA